MKKLNLKAPEKPIFNLMDIITSLLSSYLFAAIIFLMKNTGAGKEFISYGNEEIIFFIKCVLFFAVPITISVAFFKKKNICRYSFISALIIFSTLMVLKENNTLTYFVLFVVIMITLYCFGNKVTPSFIQKERKNKDIITVIVIVTLSVLFTMCMFSSLRYYCYSAPNYDFGIFCNMFYNMKENGTAVTTCERDKLLSHFAVHISPIFYLLLPVYYLFSTPVTLAVMQPVIIFSAVIPLYLIAKHLKISNNAILFFTIAFALYAPLSTGCFYDLHENCFLVPLLMWTFYFFEKNKKIPLTISVLLVLLVKEDAFIYIAFFALYVFVSRKKYITGSLMLVFAGCYFLFASYLLTKYGTGIMSSRYANLADGGGLLESAKTILLNPGFAIKQVLETKEETMDKILYLMEILCPIVFIPFMTKDFTRYILILPMFINLLTKYPHQYDITFQYTFGISAFLFYFSLLNISEMNPKRQKGITFASLIAAFLLFTMIVTPKYTGYLFKYADGADTYTAISEALETIPEDAEVTASAYLVAHLADRDVIYEDEYHDKPTTEYIVLDRTRSAAEGREKMYVDAGYELIYEIDGVLEIYKNEEMAK